AARRRFSALSLNCHPDRVPQARSVCLGLGSLLLDCGGSPPLFRPKPELSSRPGAPGTECVPGSWVSPLDCGGSPPLFRPKPELSSRPERPDCFFRAAFWRVGPRSGGIAAPLARAHLRRAHRAPLPHTPLMLFSV